MLVASRRVGVHAWFLVARTSELFENTISVSKGGDVVEAVRDQRCKLSSGLSLDAQKGWKLERLCSDFSA